MPEISGEPAPVENRTHADVVERVESIEQSAPGLIELGEPSKTSHELLEFLDFRLQILPDVGVEIVSIDVTTILYAVAESGVDLSLRFKQSKIESFGIVAPHKQTVA